MREGAAKPRGSRATDWPVEVLACARSVNGSELREECSVPIERTSSGTIESQRLQTPAALDVH